MSGYEKQFKSVMGKRKELLRRGEVSVEDGKNAPVAILVPYLAERSTDPRDRFGYFVKQAMAYEKYYTKKKREPFTILGASIKDFRNVLTNPEIPNLVIAGWGSFSSINVPFARDRSKDARWGRLRWTEAAAIATHVKLGEVVMAHCSGYAEDFNPPLALGIVSEHSNILGNPGEPYWVADAISNGFPMPPIIEEGDLTYRAIRDNYKMQTRYKLPVNDATYMKLQSFWNAYINPNMPDIPDPSPIDDIPEINQFRKYFNPAGAQVA